MLLIGFKDLGQTILAEKYKDKFNIVNSENYITPNQTNIIPYLEEIKSSVNTYEVTYITYTMEIIPCIEALNIEYILVYKEDSNDIVIKSFNKLKCKKFILNDKTSLEQKLAETFNWVQLEQDNTLTKEQQSVQEELIPAEINKSKLTLNELLDENVEITEADIRDMKAIQNKLKIGMLLQAKSSLKRILKLSNILDKLYDNLLDRIDVSLASTDTASLMYTAEYINKALSDTNQFVMSLINNEKIQNFFIIDNSSVINVTDDKIDVNKREKIRKAAEIVMNNLDYFVDGDFTKLKNPNVIEVNNVDNEENIVNTTNKEEPNVDTES